jgi:hypothetical protein
LHEEHDIEQDDDPDVCHHGVGFDETCEECEHEIQEEDELERDRRVWRRKQDELR